MATVTNIMTGPQRVETARKLSLREGDLIHVKLGGDIQVGGQTETWIPTMDDLLAVYDDWAPVAVVYQSGVIVTHHLVDATLIGSQVNLSSWPPRVFNGFK